MIRWIMNYLRQCKCEHDFIVEEFTVNSQISPVERGTTNELVYMRCKKCGYHTKHLKY